MANLTVHNLDEELKQNLRQRAAEHGCSMEEEVRSILRQVLLPPATEQSLGQRLAQRFSEVSTDLELTHRQRPRTSINW